MEDSVSGMLSDMGLGSINTGRAAGIDVNVLEYKDKFVVEAKVPGFAKDQISIGFEDGMLIIEASRSSEDERKESDGSYYMHEFSVESYKRAVSLPSKVDADKAEAVLKNGIMYITLPKMPEFMSKKIQIKE